MYILIYREKRKDCHRDYTSVYEMLRELFPDEIKMKTGRTTLELFGITIDFRCGEVWKCAGTRPDYYLADTYEARNFLAKSAAKCDGKELSNLSKILTLILEYLADCDGVNKKEIP